MSDTSTHVARWIPAWHELDQTLVVGERQKYWFLKSIVGSTASPIANEVEYVFFNEPDVSENCVVRYAKIAEMSHPVLGQLSKVDADGLDYIFFPEASEEITVNAEENPGVANDSKIDIDNWVVDVKLTEVSGPVIQDDV